LLTASRADLHADIQHPATAAEPIVLLAWRLEVAAGAATWTRKRRIS
jgi:hypothetical protein